MAADDRVTRVDDWTEGHIGAMAPRTVVAAESITGAGSWRRSGGRDGVLWGTCRTSRDAESAYEVFVDTRTEAPLRIGGRPGVVTASCTCPSRRYPCKHVVALMLRWVRGHVPDGPLPAIVERWLDEVQRAGSGPVGPAGSDRAGSGRAGDAPSEPLDRASVERPPLDRQSVDQARNDRLARVAAGLADLDRWLEDRMRTGLADPSLARYETWDRVAARLVDAGAGALAGRVRRIAGLVGVGSGWQERVLTELAMLHLITSGARRPGTLPSDLGDAVGTAVGWQVKQADVAAGVPETDVWIVCGRSDAREERIDARRYWLRGATTGRWALILEFAAHRESLADSFLVGERVHADLHRYPGGSPRAIVGRRHEDVGGADDRDPAGRLRAVTVAAACDEIGRMVLAEPWTERVPATVTVAPAVADGRWVLTDGTGSLPLVDDPRPVAALLAATTGRSVTVTVEWSPWGVRPLAVHLTGTTIDVGPRIGDPGGWRA